MRKITAKYSLIHVASERTFRDHANRIHWLVVCQFSGYLKMNLKLVKRDMKLQKSPFFLLCCKPGQR